MKMIHDVDRYYECYYALDKRPAWMKSERFDYCDSSMPEQENRSILAAVKKLFH